MQESSILERRGERKDVWCTTLDMMLKTFDATVKMFDVTLQQILMQLKVMQSVQVETPPKDKMLSEPVAHVKISKERESRTTMKQKLEKESVFENEHRSLESVHNKEDEGKEIKSHHQNRKKTSLSKSQIWSK